MKNRVLITGGFGNLGGRLAIAQSGGGAVAVRLASRALRVAPEWLPHAETVQLDLMSKESLLEALVGIQNVIHLASPNEHASALDPGETMRSASGGTANLVAAAEESGVKRFIYMSTAHIYGSPMRGHIDEATVPRPTNAYAISHLAAEQFVSAAHDREKMVGVVLRSGNGFGYPVHSEVDTWHLVINDLCRQAVSTRTLKLRSTGTQERNFITISDIAMAVTLMTRVPREKLGNGIFNLGESKSTSVLAMATMVADRCEAKFNFRPQIERPQDANEKILKLYYDTAKIAAIGFSPMSNFSAEIDGILDLCRTGLNSTK